MEIIINMLAVYFVSKLNYVSPILLFKFKFITVVFLK